MLNTKHSRRTEKKMIIVVIFLMTASISYASFLDRELSTMSRKFAGEIERSGMGKSVTLGVSNFNCLDLSMSQRQIGTGIAELLVSALNKEKGDTIILIERNQISKVL